MFRVIPEYQRAIFFRFGRVKGEAKGPGLIFKAPFIDKIVKVNLRVDVVDIPSQSVITKDNVTIAVDAVVYFQVIEPVRAVIGVDNFRFASQRIAMTSLRSIVGRYELDALLAHREDVNTELRATIARSTTEWGVEVRQVEIRDINLPPELLRAMARQAEAERERRAKIIAATGELQASLELAEAADRLTASPGALQLRTLQTLAEVATEKNSTLVFPIPIELLNMFEKIGGAVQPTVVPREKPTPRVADADPVDIEQALSPSALAASAALEAPLFENGPAPSSGEDEAESRDGGTANGADQGAGTADSDAP